MGDPPVRYHPITNGMRTISWDMPVQAPETAPAKRPADQKKRPTLHRYAVCSHRTRTLCHGLWLNARLAVPPEWIQRLTITSSSMGSGKRD